MEEKIMNTEENFEMNDVINVEPELIDDQYSDCEDKGRGFGLLPIAAAGAAVVGLGAVAYKFGKNKLCAAKDKAKNKIKGFGRNKVEYQIIEQTEEDGHKIMTLKEIRRDIDSQKDETTEK